MESKASELQADEAANAVLDTVPLVMRTLRRELRRSSGEGLSMPQFHALLYIRRHPGTGLSGVAEHVGATLPATSELVNRLVGSGLVCRAPNPSERRRISLSLTSAGEGELEATLADARTCLRRALRRLQPAEVSRLRDAMTDLHAVLRGEAPES